MCLRTETFTGGTGTGGTRTSWNNFDLKVGVGGGAGGGVECPIKNKKCFSRVPNVHGFRTNTPYGLWVGKFAHGREG